MLVEFQSVREAVSKRGNKYLIAELASGEKLYVWDTVLFPIIRPGRVLDVAIEGQNGFKRIVRASEPQQVPRAAEAGPEYQSAAECRAEGRANGSEPLEVRGDRALRAIALKAAVELLARQPKPDAERVLKYAEVFYDWLTGA